MTLFACVDRASTGATFKHSCKLTWLCFRVLCRIGDQVKHENKLTNFVSVHVTNPRPANRTVANQSERSAPPGNIRDMSIVSVWLHMVCSKDKRIQMQLR